MSNHGLDLLNGLSIKKLADLPVKGFSLKLRVPKKVETAACGNYVLVLPLNAKLWPQGNVALGRTRADRSCVLVVSAALQFIEAARSVGCPWYIETVQNRDMRREADRAASASDEQTWRSLSVEQYRIWAVLDPAQMKMFSALYRTQLNTVEAQDADVSEAQEPSESGRRSKVRRRGRSTSTPVTIDPVHMSASAGAIKSVHRMLEVWHMLFDSDRRVVPQARDVDYGISTEATAAAPAATSRSGGEQPAFGGLDFSDNFDADDADDGSPGQAGGTTAESGQAGASGFDTHPRGTLQLPDNHILAPVQADTVFGTKAHRRNMRAGNVIPWQQSLNSYFAGEGLQLKLVFDERRGGPVRTHEELARWLDTTEELKQYGLPDRVEPTFAVALAHLSRAAHTANMDLDTMPRTHDELLDLLEEVCDPTEAGNPWIIPKGLGVGAGEIAGERWAPNMAVLTDDIYAEAYAAKAVFARAMALVGGLVGDSEDTVDITLARLQSVWMSVFNIPGGAVPQVFSQTYEATEELIQTVRTPKSQAAQYAKQIIDSTVAAHMTRIGAMLELKDPGAVRRVSFATVDMVWMWSMFKLYRLSNQQTAIVVLLRCLQGALGVMETTGANMLVTLQGDFAIGKSVMMETSASALYDFLIAAVTSFSAQADLDVVVHKQQVIDDAAQASKDPNSIRTSVITAGVAYHKRNMRNDDINDYETKTQVAVMRSVLRVKGTNWKERPEEESRSTAIIAVSKSDNVTSGSSIGELAAGPSGACAALGAAMVMKIETGMMFRFWTVVVLIGGVDMTMFHVGLAVTRECFKRHGKDFDKVLDARAIGHTKKTAQGMLGARIGRYSAFFRRGMGKIDFFKSMIADSIMSGEDTMKAITQQVMQRSAAAHRMRNKVVGGMKMLVQLMPTKTEIVLDEENDAYFMLTVKGRSPDVMVQALDRIIKDHNLATIEAVFRTISGKGGVDAMRLCTKQTPPRWMVHRSVLCSVSAFSPIERAVWTAIGGWIDAAKKSGMTTGVVKLSWCGRYWVLTPKAMDMLRRPQTHDDSPDCIRAFGEDVMLSALTVMNQCDLVEDGGGGLQTSSTRDGPLVNLVQEVSIFLGVETDARCVACPDGSVERGIVGGVEPLFKRKSTLEGCGIVARSDFDTVRRLLKNKAALPPALEDAWQITLRSENAVRDGSFVGAMVDPDNEATGTVLLKTDYDAVTIDSVPTPGYSGGVASAFAAVSDKMPNTVLPVAPFIDTRASAEYARKSRIARANKYNLEERHFCPIDVTELMGRHA